MYLKQLELIGFKSFCDRTRLNFEPGIISIVGPNGCGKTNIVDAIRWSLGEQSAKSLRGKSMEDIIFHGTSERKGFGMAEVSLTIDNSKRLLPIEFSEVTITRRVFRSGEGQYFINKNLCRLKDIDNLFMDTGIGTRAYSVMEQGKMDLILSSKPEDRRYVFEEAAGITKYKEQKREALRKLEVAENNLIRLNDILKEVQRQIGSIERQAAKARRYKKIKDELKDLEIKNLAYQFKNLKEKYSEYEQEKAEIEKQSLDMHSYVEEREEKVKKLRSTLQQLTAERISLQNEKTSIETDLVSNEQQLRYETEKAQEIKQRNITIDEHLKSLFTETESLSSELQTVIKQLDEASNDKHSRKEVLDSKQREVDEVDSKLKSTKKDLDSKREKFLDLVAKESHLKNELIRIDFENKNIILKERKDIVDINKKKKQLQNTTSELQKTDEILKAHKESLQNLQQAAKDREEKVLLLKDEITKIQSNIQEKNRTLTEKHSQYEIFSTQKKTYEGCSNGVKFVLENKHQFKGVIGTVSNILQVHRRYRKAIEAVLKNIQQYIVMDSLLNTYNIISHLKKMDVSQTTFLTMDILKNKSVLSETDSVQGVRAIDAVKFDNNYSTLAEYLLGNVLIVKDTETAKKLLSETERPLTIVTQEGVVFDSCGISKVGSKEATISVIHRDSEIEELKRELQKASEEILALTQKQRFIEGKLKQEEGQLEGARNTLYREEVNLGILENDIIKLISTVQQIDEEIQILESEINDSSNEKETLNKRHEEINIELEETSKLTLTLDNISKGLNTEYIKLEQIKDSLEKKYIELKISLISAEEKENHLSFKNDQFQTQLSSSRNNMEEMKREKSRNEILLTQLTKDILGAESNIGSLTEKRTEIEVKITETSEICDKSEKELAQYEDSIFEERTQRDKLSQNLNAQQLKLAELNLKIDNIAQKLQEQYRIDRTAISSVNTENISIEETENQILTLRSKLDSMGEVSLVAIEEHESLQERYEFLSSQRQDLVGAKESLLKAITKINSTTKKLFWDTFQEIKKNFNEIFSRLFRGGKADLILLDESDILESGIEIIARPPGKRLQNVSLLSGGEKALTAISLMFAMFKVKPSPFCILDEIDAPLDDSNIERFINLLKEFSKTSQFLIVTHNKRTIGASCALYGITMEENGISKVVSVKLPASTTTAK